MDPSDESAHKRAAEGFVQAARDRFDEDLEAIHLFGSVARGEERGVDSDVNLLVVLSDETDDSRITDAIRDLAYEVELDHGIVLSLVVRAVGTRPRSASTVRPDGNPDRTDVVWVATAIRQRNVGFPSEENKPQGVFLRTSNEMP